MKDMYRMMVRIRAVEEALVGPILSGEVKTPCHLYSGERLDCGTFFRNLVFAQRRQSAKKGLFMQGGWGCGIGRPFQQGALPSLGFQHDGGGHGADREGADEDFWEVLRAKRREQGVGDQESGVRG